MPGYSKQVTTASKYVLVAPNDAADLPGGMCRALYVNSGDVSVVSPLGVVTLFVGVSGILPIGTARVRATATTATNIVALY